MRKAIRFIVLKLWWVFPLLTIVFNFLVFPLVDYGIIAMLLLVGLSVAMLFIQLPIFIVLLVKKKWWRAAGAFFAGILSFISFVMFPLLLLSMYLDSQPDDFGKLHPIPEDMECELPLGGVSKYGDTLEYPSDEEVKLQPEISDTDTSTWLQIWNDGQGGRYKYAFYWPALPDGVVYLRCFETTENIELSPSAMSRNTKVEVAGHSSFGPLVESCDFVIYEGDWEEYYAVRVEVWHKPNNGKAHKLMQKTYRMEGWMR